MLGLMKDRPNLGAAIAAAIIAPTVCVVAFSVFLFAVHEVAVFAVLSLFVVMVHVVVIGLPAFVGLKAVGWQSPQHYALVGFFAGSLPVSAWNIFIVPAQAPSLSVANLGSLGIFGALGALSALAAWWAGGLRSHFVKTQPGTQPNGTEG